MTTSLDEQLEALGKQLQTIKLERVYGKRSHDELCREKDKYHGYLKSKMDRVFKTVNTNLRIEGHYDNAERQSMPSRKVLDYQTQILSRSVRVRAQKYHLRRMRKQNKLCARHLMCTKWVLEEEKEDVDKRQVKFSDMHKQLEGLLKERYTRQLQVQRMVLMSLRCKLNIQDTTNPTTSSPRTKPKSWGFPLRMRGTATQEDKKKSPDRSPTTTISLFPEGGFRHLSHQLESSTRSLDINFDGDISDLMLAALNGSSEKIVPPPPPLGISSRSIHH